MKRELKLTALCRLITALCVLTGCGSAVPPITGPAWLNDGCRDWVHDASGGVTWTANDDVDGIKTFTGEVPGSAFVAFRGTGKVNAPIGRVANVLIDLTRHSEWVPNFGGMRLLRDITKEEKVIYRHVITPAVIDDRDFVVHVKTYKDEKSGHLVFAFESTKDDKAPVEDGKVRGVIHKRSGYRMWPVDGGKRTMVIFTFHVDPRGSVPAWIVNLFQDSYPLNNMRNIRDQATKSDVKPHPEVEEAFRDYKPKCSTKTTP